MNVTIQVQCPDAELSVLLDLLRAFEQRDPAHIHLQISGGQTTLTEQDLHARLARMTPPMEMVVTLRKLKDIPHA